MTGKLGMYLEHVVLHSLGLLELSKFEPFLLFNTNF